MARVSARDKLHCIERELNVRYHVYKKRVADGKMSQRQADREINILEDIAADYRWLSEHPHDDDDRPSIDLTIL
jgi:hypothetical protein